MSKYKHIKKTNIKKFFESLFKSKKQETYYNGTGEYHKENNPYDDIKITGMADNHSSYSHAEGYNMSKSHINCNTVDTINNSDGATELLNIINRMMRNTIYGSTGLTQDQLSEISKNYTYDRIPIKGNITIICPDIDNLYGDRVSEIIEYKEKLVKNGYIIYDTLYLNETNGMSFADIIHAWRAIEKSIAIKIFHMRKYSDLILMVLALAYISGKPIEIVNIDDFEDINTNALTNLDKFILSLHNTAIIKTDE